jgi:hypothetical protein
MQRYEKYSKLPNISETFFYENEKIWHGAVWVAAFSMG